MIGNGVVRAENHEIGGLFFWGSEKARKEWAKTKENQKTATGLWPGVTRAGSGRNLEANLLILSNVIMRPNLTTEYIMRY